MRKTAALFFLLFFLLAASLHAQSVVVPEGKGDSTLSPDIDEKDQNEKSSGFAKDVLSDTTISFSNFSIEQDSISALWFKKEYDWVTNIDSFLIAQKKEEGKQSKIIIKQDTGGSFLSDLFNSGLLQAVMWAIAAALVLFIIYRLFLSEGVFTRRSAKTGINLQKDEDDIRLVNDYEKLLRKAYGDGNWRFAMRFLFLKTLKKLNENRLINYTVDKTNSVYVKELPAAKRNDFASLSLYYEYIWYGNAAIEKNVFDSIENKFNNFLNKI